MWGIMSRIAFRSDQYNSHLTPGVREMIYLALRRTSTKCVPAGIASRIPRSRCEVREETPDRTPKPRRVCKE